MTYASGTSEGCLNRISDKYQGVRMCEMTQHELEEFLGGIAQRGAADALKALGLDDEMAVNDIRDLRDILKGFRVVKKNIWSTTMAGFGRIIGWILIITVAGLMVEHNPMAKNIAKIIAE